MEKEAEDLQDKADAAEEKAKAARATAKKLKKATGQGDDDDDDQEFGVSKKAKKHSKSEEGAAGPTGVSVVQFTMESKDKAERLTSELLSNYLIADSQIINNNYERSFMKYKKMVQMDGQVKAKFITADDKVPALLRFIENNNPNDKNSEIAPDIITT